MSAEVAYVPDPRSLPIHWDASRNFGSFNLTGGGSGGTGVQQIFGGAAHPAAPTNPALPAKFIPNESIGGPEENWDVPNQHWY